jgi:hypothetical protein
MKTNKQQILHCWNISKSKIKIVERGKIDTCNTHIHDRSLSWLDTDTSIKSGGLKLALRAQASLLNVMMRLYKCLPHVNKMPTLIIYEL